MTTINDLELRVEKIEKRNQSVEIDKAWETSKTRKLLLVVFTYSIIGTYMYAIGVVSPWINAVIPTLGFMLSTLTLPFFKKFWVKSISK